MGHAWAETVRAHRSEVREAILEAAGELVRSRGLMGITMSDIAAAAGIGRATLYRYFPDAAQVLAAWHDRQVASHLSQLAAIRDGPGEHAERLRAVLAAYGRICRQRGQHVNLIAAAHPGPPSDDRRGQLRSLVSELIAEAAVAGAIRDDVPPDELAAYCIGALEAAGSAATEAQLARLLQVIWAGLEPPATRA